MLPAPLPSLGTMQDNGVGILSLHRLSGGLLLILDGQKGQPFPAIASGCAAVKFALAGAALIYVLIGTLMTRRSA